MKKGNLVNLLGKVHSRGSIPQTGKIINHTYLRSGDVMKYQHVKNNQNINIVSLLQQLPY